MLEELRKKREFELSRAGEAQRLAQEQEAKHIREQIELKEKAIRDSKNAKNRGVQALKQERKLLEEKR